MKKILAFGAAAALTLSAFGQGIVQFQNRDTANTPNVVAPIFLDSVGGTVLSGTDTSFHAALLGGATTGTAAYIPSSRTNGPSGGSSVQGTLSLLASPSTAATWVTFRTGAAAGYVAVGTDTGRDTGLAFGSQALVQVVAWNGGFTTWAAAYAAWQSGTPGVKIGASNPLTVTLPSGPTDPNLTRLVGLESFAIVGPTIVPEPSTFALAGLGAAALLIFRRRK